MSAFRPLEPGQRGDDVRELQHLLAAAGFLAPSATIDGSFCDRTAAALRSFQQAFGVHPDGRCSEESWQLLHEASWTLGDRLLFTQQPMMRGEDVADLQSRLSRLGFDCGRVDGIYGPRTASAVADFQRNCGLDPSGSCGPDVVLTLGRVAGQSGSGPGIAVIRQHLDLTPVDPLERKVVVGQFGALSALAHAVTRRLRADHPLTIGVDGGSTQQAEAANRYGAAAYIGIEPASSEQSVVHFFSVPTFESVGGRLLAERVGKAVQRTCPDLAVSVEGGRRQILRETRMPAIILSLAPLEVVTTRAAVLVMAISAAVIDWMGAPL